MKRIVPILIAVLAVLSLNAKAQGLVYTPFIPQQSSSSSGTDGWFGGGSASRPRPGSRTQVIRTTAYYVDYGGDYYKVPIRVEYTVFPNGAASLCVTQRWQSNGFNGQWYSLPSRAAVQGCQSITANGRTAELERAFMYKAMVGTDWYYFDL